MTKETAPRHQEPSGSPVEEVAIGEWRDEIEGLVSSVHLETDHLDDADHWLVFRDRERIVGCMALERRGNLVHIQSLCVAKDHRKQGIARALVDYGMDHYMDPGEMMTALTLFWNVPIYEHMGFARVNAADMKKTDDVTGREKHRYCAALVKVKE